MQHAPPSIRENDVVVVLNDATAWVMGEPREVTITRGSKGAVVLVHAPSGAVEAFEVEFEVGEGSYALATVPVHSVQLEWQVEGEA